jgi:hypothetical protein
MNFALEFVGIMDKGIFDVKGKTYRHAHRYF